MLFNAGGGSCCQVNCSHFASLLCWFKVVGEFPPAQCVDGTVHCRQGSKCGQILLHPGLHGHHIILEKNASFHHLSEKKYTLISPCTWTRPKRRPCKGTRRRRRRAGAAFFFHTWTEKLLTVFSFLPKMTKMRSIKVA